MTLSLSTGLRRVAFALGFATLGAIGAVGLTAAAGRGGHGGPGMRGGHALMGAIAQLDLDAEQQAALDQARADIVARVQQTRQDRGDVRQELLEGLQDGSLDRAALHTAVDERMAEQAEAMHYGVDRMMDVYELLDDEQRAELATLVEQARAQRREGRGGGYGPGGGYGRGGGQGPGGDLGPAPE